MDTALMGHTHNNSSSSSGMMMHPEDTDTTMMMTPKPTRLNRMKPPQNATNLEGFEEKDRLRICVALLRHISHVSGRWHASSLTRTDEEFMVEFKAIKKVFAQYSHAAYEQLPPMLRRLVAEETRLPITTHDGVHAHLTRRLNDLHQSQHIRIENEKAMFILQQPPISDAPFYPADLRSKPQAQGGRLVATPLRSLCHYYAMDIDMRFGAFGSITWHPWVAWLRWYFEFFSSSEVDKNARFHQSLGHSVQSIELTSATVYFVSPEASSSSSGMIRPFVSASLSNGGAIDFQIYAADMHEREKNEAALRGLTRLVECVMDPTHVYTWAYSLRLFYHVHQLKLLSKSYDAVIQTSQANMETTDDYDDYNEGESIALSNMETMRGVANLKLQTEAYCQIVEDSLPKYNPFIDTACKMKTRHTKEQILKRIVNVDLTATNLPKEGVDDWKPFLMEVLLLGLQMERSMSIAMNDHAGNLVTYYHFPIVCLGQINLLVIEQKQRFHLWSRFLAWFLRYTSQMPEPYKKKILNDCFKNQTLVVCEALSIVFNPHTRSVTLSHLANGKVVSNEAVALYGTQYPERFQAEKYLVLSVSRALMPPS